jgi:hypothetical protein
MFWDAPTRGTPRRRRLALTLCARQRTGAGEAMAGSAQALAQRIVDQLTRQTGDALLEAAFAEEGETFDLPPGVLAQHVLMRRALAGHRGLVKLDAGLNLPVIGLGASAPTYYPAVGEALNCAVSIPEHAHVANAIGAVVGRITLRRSATLTSPSEGLIRAHLEDGPRDFTSLEAALSAVESALSVAAREAAEQAGAAEIHLALHRDIRTATVEDKEVFIGAEITAEATGRPRIAE